MSKPSPTEPAPDRGPPGLQARLDTLAKAVNGLRAEAHDLPPRLHPALAELAAAVNDLEQFLGQSTRADLSAQGHRETLRLEFRSLPMPAYMWRKTDDDFALIDCSDAAVQFTQGRIYQYFGQTTRQMYPHYPEFLEDMSRCYRERIAMRKEMAYQFVSTGELRHLIVTYVYVPPDLVMVHTVDISERVRAEEALKREQELLRQMVTTQDRDRKLLACEIHDGLAQQLAAAQMFLTSFRELLPAEPEKAWKAFEGGLESLSQGLAEARHLISGLMPPALEQLGVVAALEQLVREVEASDGPHVEFISQVQFDRLVSPLENALFRIVQECLTNARRHSQSSKVLVRLTQRGDRVRLEVRDWGVGFAPAQVPKDRFGLQGIRHRARLWGGRVHIRSVPGRGTRVLVELPLVLHSDPPSPRKALQ